MMSRKIVPSHSEYVFKQHECIFCTPFLFALGLWRSVNIRKENHLQMLIPNPFRRLAVPSLRRSQQSLLPGKVSEPQLWIFQVQILRMLRITFSSPRPNRPVPPADRYISATKSERKSRILRFAKACRRSSCPNKLCMYGQYTQ